MEKEEMKMVLFLGIPFETKVEISKNAPDLFNPGKFVEEIREAVENNSDWDFKKLCQLLAEKAIGGLRDCRDFGLDDQGLVKGFLETVWYDFEEDLKKSYISWVTKNPGEGKMHFYIRKNIEKRYISNVFLAVTQLLGDTLCKMLEED